MRQAWLGAVCALVFTACGGGGPGQALTFETAALEGLVAEIDGQNLDLAGVEVRILETGAAAFTGADGSFTFEGLTPGNYTLAFDTALNAAAQGARLAQEGEREDDAGEREGDNEERERERDENEDGEGRPVIEVTNDCGVVTLIVKLEGGEVKEFILDEHETRFAKGKLFAVEGLGFGVAGHINLTAKNDREVFTVRVEEFAPGTVLEFFIRLRDEERPVSIGTAIADGRGEVIYTRDTGAGQSLPRNVDTLDALAGARLEVAVMAAELRVLVGEVPDLPDEAEHDCEREGERDGGGDAEKEGDEKEGDAEKESDERDGDAEKESDEKGDAEKESDEKDGDAEKESDDGDDKESESGGDGESNDESDASGGDKKSDGDA